MKKYNYVSLLPLVAIALLASCSGEKKETTTAVSEAAPAIRIESVSVQSVAQLEEFTATVEADVTNNISPSAPLRIKNILVEVGDHVRKGQTLVLMDQANLEQNKTQLENLEADFKRTDELYKIGSVSESAWLAQKTQLTVAKTAFNNLLENTKLVSPISGIITARNYDNGDVFGQMPVLTVATIAPVKLKVNVSESLYTTVNEGMDVVVKADVYGDEEFEGVVTLKYPTLDPQTRTFPVEITVANKEERLRPGMFARITLDLGSKEHVVAPDRAIVKQQGSGDKYIYVYNNGKVSFQKVVLGRQLGDKYEIVEGVADGDQVVVTGISRLKDGIEVVLDNNAY